MNAQLKNPINFFWWLRHPLFWWIKVGVISAKDGNKIEIPRDAPVLYVLSHRSLSDLLVLYYFCKKFGLPLPRTRVPMLRKPGQAGYLYLSKLGFLSVRRQGGPPSPLQKLCVRLAAEPKTQLQIIPVSVIWGRNPGKQERSLFKLLFPDDEHAGILQKLFIILAQGRSTFLHFGQPLDLREQVLQNNDAEQVARKTRRILRVHFRNQRNITLGPKTYDRTRVMRFLFDSRTVQNAIDVECKKTGAPRAKVEAKAWHYLREISAAQTYSIIRFFDVLLTFVWNKIYQGVQVYAADGLRDIAKDHEIIYVPSHRSHLDYLVLPYELYHRGLATPHTAAGVNLSFWPLGPLLRRGGGFFIRRSFGGNRLYTIVFTEYLNYLIIKGHPITFFAEGGRSRTGRLLQAKTGMLSMIVRSYLRDPTKPVAFVPVFLAYDKVAEAKTYFRELRGAAKKKENVVDLLKTWKVLRGKHGKAYVSFGKPLLLDEYLDHVNPDWRKADENLENKPKWLTQVVANLAEDSMRRVNRATVVSPVALISTVLLASPQRALATGELYKTLDMLRRLLAGGYQNPAFVVPDENAEALVRYVEEITTLSRFAYPDGEDVMYLNEIDANILVYYRNNIIHLMVIPTLIARYVQVSIHEQEIVTMVERFLPLFAVEYCLPWTTPEVADAVRRLLAEFVGNQLLVKSEGKYSPPTLMSETLAPLKLIARMLGFAVDRYAIGIALLIAASERKGISRSNFEKGAIMLAAKLAALSAVADPEVVSDAVAFRNFLERVKELGLSTEDADGMLRASAKGFELRPYVDVLLEQHVWAGIRKYLDSL